MGIFSDNERKAAPPTSGGIFSREEAKGSKRGGIFGVADKGGGGTWESPKRRPFLESIAGAEMDPAALGTLSPLGARAADEALGVTDGEGPVSKGARDATAIAANFLTPTIGLGAAAPIAKLPGIGRLAAGALTGALSGAAGNTAEAVLNTQPGDIGEKARTGALWGVGLGSAFAGLMGAAEQLLPKMQEFRPQDIPILDDITEKVPQLSPYTSTLRQKIGEREKAVRTGTIFAGLSKAFQEGKTLTAAEMTALHERAALAGSKATLTKADEAELMNAIKRVDDAFIGSNTLSKRSVTHGTNPNLLPATAREARKFINKALNPLIKSLRTDTEFGSVGKMLARNLEDHAQLSDQFTAHADEYLRRAFEPLSGKERLLADAIIRGEKTQIGASKKVLDAVDKWREFADEGARTLRSNGVYEADPVAKKEFLFRPRQNYAPQFYDRREVHKFLNTDSPERRAALKKFAQLAGIKNQKKALDALRDLLTHGEFSPSGDIRNGPLQWSRVLDLPIKFERDPLVWGQRYSAQLGRRLATAKIFGGRDQHFATLKKILAKEQGGNVDRMEQIFSAATGKPLSVEASSSARLLRNAISLTAFDVGTGIMQQSQLIPTMAIHGIRNTMRAMMGSLNPELRAQVQRSAALMPSIHNFGTDEDFLSEVARRYVSLTGIKASDKSMRYVGAIAGSLRAQEAAAEFAKLAQKGVTKGRKFEALRRELGRAGLITEDVIKNGGKLSDGELLTAMYTGANRSNLASRHIDLPELANTPVGRFVYMLRKFGIQSAALLEREVLSEAKRGNFRPLMRMGAVGVPVATMIRLAMDASRGKKDSKTAKALETLGYNPSDPGAWWDLVQNAATLGMLGTWGDVLNEQTLKTPQSIASFVTGPAVSLPAELLWGAAHPKELPSVLDRRIPFIGKYIHNQRK